MTVWLVVVTRLDAQNGQTLTAFRSSFAAAEVRAIGREARIVMLSFVSQATRSNTTWPAIRQCEAQEVFDLLERENDLST